MKNKVRQLFRDKLVLVMTVLGLLTIVAAAGTVKIRKDNAQDGRNPYLDVPQTEGILAEEMPQNRLEENDGQAETRAQVAGSSDASYSVNNRDEADQKPMEEEKESSLGAGAAAARALSYNGTDRLSWPVQGNVILDYSMDSTIYFPTLDQYKCNPALIIQGDVSEPVAAPAEAQVTEVGSNEETAIYESCAGSGKRRLPRRSVDSSKFRVARQLGMWQKIRYWICGGADQILFD